MKLLLGDLIERDISYQVLLSLLIVMILIGGIDFIFLFLNELSDLSLLYNLKEIFIYCLKSFPYRLFDLTSYICLVGLIVGIGSLSDRGELLGAQILGKSLTSIAIAAFRPVLLIMILGLLASQFVIPSLSQSAEENRSQLQDKLEYDISYWNRGSQNISSFVSAPESGRILGLTVYEFGPNNRISKVIFAKEAFFRSGKWESENKEIINLQDVATQTQNKIENLPVLNLDMDQMLSPRYLSLTNLYIQSKENFSKYRKKQLSLEFWRKVLQPLVTFSLVLLAMSFLFGPIREKKTGQRILIAIGVAFIVDLSQKLLGSISVVSEIPTIISVLLPIGFIIFISLILLKRV
tara:strand:- start:3642 stop:4691 length:1050 start_codon:yes stop_codon:yes gene_type:complete